MLPSSPSHPESHVAPDDDPSGEAREPVERTWQFSGSQSLVMSHGIWSVFGKFANLCVAFLNTALVARLLTPVEFADLNALRTLMMLLAIGLASGLAQNALRRLGRLSPIERDSNVPAQLVRRSLVQFTVAAAIVAGISFAILATVGHDLVRSTLPLGQSLIAMLGILLIGCSELVSEIHRGLGRPGTANLLGGTKGAPFATLLFVMMLAIAGIAGRADFATANTLFVVASAVTVTFGLRSLFRQLHQSGHSHARIIVPAADSTGDDATTIDGAATDAAHAARIVRDFDQPWRSAVPLSLSMMISFAMLQGDLVLVGGISSSEDSAAYVGARRCIQLISIPLMVVNTMAAGVITPLLSSGRSQMLERILRGFCGAAALPALIMSAAFLLAPEFSLRLILGNGYSSGAPALRMLVPGQLLYVLSGSCGLLLTLKGCRRSVLSINLVSLLTLIIAGPIAGRQYGSVGLATVVTVIIGLNNIVTWATAYRLTGINTWCSLAWLMRLRRLMASAKTSSWQFRSRSGATHVR